MEETVGSGDVDGGNGFDEESGGFFFVAGFHGGEELLDRGFHRRDGRFVSFGLLFGYQNALFSGFDVGHFVYLLQLIIKLLAYFTIKVFDCKLFLLQIFPIFRLFFKKKPFRVESEGQKNSF